MSVSRLLPEERRRIILGLHGDEAIVATQTPAAGVPLHTSTDIGREKRGGVVDADLGYVASRPPRDRAYRRALDEEINRLRTFLGLEAIDD